MRRCAWMRLSVRWKSAPQGRSLAGREIPAGARGAEFGSGGEDMLAAQQVRKLPRRSLPRWNRKNHRRKPWQPNEKSFRASAGIDRTRLPRKKHRKPRCVCCPAQRAFDQLGEQVRRDAERLRALREEMRGLDEQYRSRLPQLQSRCDEWSSARQKKSSWKS